MIMDPEFYSVRWAVTAAEICAMSVAVGGCAVSAFDPFPGKLYIYVPSEYRYIFIDLCYKNLPAPVHWQVIGFRPKPLKFLEFNRG